MKADNINAYPLCWPTSWQRVAPGFRVTAKFGRARRSIGGGHYEAARPLTLAESLQRALEELQRMGIDRQDVIVSTNVRTRLDGFPRSGEPEPQDPGAAVYWQEPGGKRRVMAIDLYDRVADNLAAIAATLEAMRSIERHGGAMVLERAFSGFLALPAPSAKRHWREVMGFALDQHVYADLLRERYRSRASTWHPDRGGSEAEMAELNVARDEALKELEQ